jgi:hypothetical protein
VTSRHRHAHRTAIKDGELKAPTQVRSPPRTHQCTLRTLAERLQTLYPLPTFVLTQYRAPNSLLLSRTVTSGFAFRTFPLLAIPYIPCVGPNFCFGTLTTASEMSTPYKVPRPQHSTSGESRTGRFNGSPTGAPVSNHGLEAHHVQQYEYYDQSLVETDPPYVPDGGFGSRHHHYSQGVSPILFYVSAIYPYFSSPTMLSGTIILDIL